MLELIFTLVIGLFIAAFALQNTNTVTVLLGNFMFSQVPVYLIVGSSLFAGIALSWIIHLLQSIGTAMEVRGKNQSIKHAEKEIEKLREKIHRLELENAQLSGASRHTTEEKHVPKDETHLYKPSILDTLRHKLQPH